jgi:hypothetical protein
MSLGAANIRLCRDNIVFTPNKSTVPRRSPMLRKSCCESQLHRPATHLRRKRTPVCEYRGAIYAAQYVRGASVTDRNDAPGLSLRPIGALRWYKVRKAPDFSTDAGNSALILDNEISASTVAPDQACRRRRKKQQRDFQAYHDWLTREGTPCHGRSFLVVNSLLLPPCHPRR